MLAWIPDWIALHKTRAAAQIPIQKSRSRAFRFSAGAYAFPKLSRWEMINGTKKEKARQVTKAKNRNRGSRESQPVSYTHLSDHLSTMDSVLFGEGLIGLRKHVV